MYRKKGCKKRILAAVLATALFFSNFGLQDKVRAVYAEEVSEEAVEEISLQTEASEGSLITGSSEEKEEASKMIDETDSKNSDVENMDIESMDDKDSTVSEEEKTDTSETKRKEEQKNKDLDSKWYVLDRPMTEEEKQEQLDLIEYYRSFNGVVEEESGSILEDGFGYGIASTEEEIPHLILQSEDSYQIPSSYSSKEKGYMPYIRTQAQGICWTFAPLASIEINLIKNNIFTKEEMDLSENHTVYYLNRLVAEPLGGTANDYDVKNRKTVYEMFEGGGSLGMTVGALMAGMGPVMEGDFFTYNELYSNYNNPSDGGSLDTTDYAYGKRAAWVVEYYEVPPADVVGMKKAIMQLLSLVGTMIFQRIIL